MHAAAVGEEVAERPAAEAARQRRPHRATFELAARLLEQARVRHARRAHRLAGAAGQAVVEVLEQRMARRDAALGEPAHQVEPPARRVGLDLERAVGRAGGEAQPAVDAGAQVGTRRRVAVVEPVEPGGARERNATHGAQHSIGDLRARSARGLARGVTRGRLPRSRTAQERLAPRDARARLGVERAAPPQVLERAPALVAAPDLGGRLGPREPGLGERGVALPRGLERTARAGAVARELGAQPVLEPPGRGRSGPRQRRAPGGQRRGVVPGLAQHSRAHREPPRQEIGRDHAPRRGMGCGARGPPGLECRKARGHGPVDGDGGAGAPSARRAVGHVREALEPGVEVGLGREARGVREVARAHAGAGHDQIEAGAGGQVVERTGDLRVGEAHGQHVHPVGRPARQGRAPARRETGPLRAGHALHAVRELRARALDEHRRAVGHVREEPVARQRARVGPQVLVHEARPGQAQAEHRQGACRQDGAPQARVREGVAHRGRAQGQRGRVGRQEIARERRGHEPEDREVDEQEREQYEARPRAPPQHPRRGPEEQRVERQPQVVRQHVEQVGRGGEVARGAGRALGEHVGPHHYVRPALRQIEEREGRGQGERGHRDRGRAPQAPVAKHRRTAPPARTPGVREDQRHGEQRRCVLAGRAEPEPEPAPQRVGEPPALEHVEGRE